ncbi:hypothetical protein DPMN_136083 [Dreissena polymorpha]|uniref:Uncharacterized protein n=1 Tax=Dreissena polymorpha TaxID=45954 RepID=A0A9D4G356_DREPO|nr:hypothetical protein DPMN_136083 [Dreissena polymorpha]
MSPFKPINTPECVRGKNNPEQWPTERDVFVLFRRVHTCVGASDISFWCFGWFESHQPAIMPKLLE